MSAHMKLPHLVSWLVSRAATLPFFAVKEGREGGSLLQQSCHACLRQKSSGRIQTVRREPANCTRRRRGGKERVVLPLLTRGVKWQPCPFVGGTFRWPLFDSIFFFLPPPPFPLPLPADLFGWPSKGKKKGGGGKEIPSSPTDTISISTLIFGGWRKHRGLHT